MKKGFNLLNEKIDSPTFWTKTYDWVLGSAKIIIIITELLIVIAFVIRFVIDLQQKELDKKIDITESTYNIVSSNEKTYRDLQSKTSSYSELIESIPEYREVINDLLKNIYVDGPITNLSLTITKDGVNLSGRTKNDQNAVIEALEFRLKNNLSFLKDTTLSKLVDDGGYLNFTFSMKIKEIEYKQLNGVKE